MDSTLLTGLLTFLVTMLIPWLFMTYLPNDKISAFGKKLGRKMSSGAGGKIGKANWESIENKFTGGLVALAEGIKDGADEDD